MNDEDANEEDAGIDEYPPPTKIKTFKEAIESLEDVQYFLQSRGYAGETLEIGSSKHLSSKQTTILDYFFKSPLYIIH